MSEEPVVRPWDSPGMPPRVARERCGRHSGLCAYRDDDEAYCPYCHRSWRGIETHPQTAESRGTHTARHVRADEAREVANARRNSRRR